MEKTVTEIVLKNLQTNLINSMLKQNIGCKNEVLEFSFDYEIEGNYIFAIAYLTTSNQNFSNIYRMEVCSIYGDRAIFQDGNVIGNVKSYTVQTVKEKCRNYFNHYAKDFNKIVGEIKPKQ